MKILRIGDPHVKPGNIEECNRLMEFSLFLANEHFVDRIEILGDLFHTHAIVRMEVLEFWNKWLPKFNKFNTVVLVGNHDMPGDHGSDGHALKVFKNLGNPTIIDEPKLIGIYGYLPYQYSGDDFLRLANELASNGAKVLICHQTISGAQYENGFFAPDAIDPAGINFSLVISGHIHKRQIINAGDKIVVYPGTARWDTLSDANELKGLTIYEHDETGVILGEDFFATDRVCKPIASRVWREGDAMPELPENATLHLELIGTSKWISETKEQFRGTASVKATITNSRISRAKLGGANMQEFIRKSFNPQVDKELLIKHMEEHGFI